MWTYNLIISLTADYKTLGNISLTLLMSDFLTCKTGLIVASTLQSYNSGKMRWMGIKSLAQWLEQSKLSIIFVSVAIRILLVYQLNSVQVSSTSLVPEALGAAKRKGWSVRSNLVQAYFHSWRETYLFKGDSPQPPILPLVKDFIIHKCLCVEELYHLKVKTKTTKKKKRLSVLLF